ncbi:acyltransferase [Bacteroides sp. GM023]|uniref:acyltransferase family protein n=1 Tax=Bacteroides sp. GM023 TaxID=2723058 RepID=UPI00168B21E7|nr:acyltransferase [Bacteroides sp. GM023]MBD3589236.1 acyltransferase [Bacteroides sp. GM023]
MYNTLILLLLLSAIFVFAKNVQNADNIPPLSHNSDELLARKNTDVYRGWAILIIMIGHISGCWNWVGLGGMGVAMFLLLSGYGLHESYKKCGIEGFWKKKLLRIVFPYVVFRIIWMMVDGDMSLHRWQSIVDCANSSFWYIDYLVRCYVAFWVACLLDKWHIKYVVLIVFALYSFFGLSILCGQQALSFIVGIVLSDNANKVSDVKNKGWVMAMSISVVLGLVALVIKHHPMIYDNGGVMFVAMLLVQNFTLAITFIIALYFTRRWVGGQLITLFGALSLELYIIHMRLLKPMVGDSVWQGLAMMITTTLLAYAFKKMTQQLIKYKIIFN